MHLLSLRIFGIHIKEMIYVYSIYHFFAGTAIDCSVYKLSYFFILRKNASMSTIPISLLQISCLQESTVIADFRRRIDRTSVQSRGCNPVPVDVMYLSDCFSKSCVAGLHLVRIIACDILASGKCFLAGKFVANL